MYEASGTIKLISEEQVFPSGFNKREFVVTTENDRYPQDLKFELVKDKCTMIESFAEGQKVLVSFDIRGNEYKGKYFVNLSAWKIQAAGDAPASAPPSASGNARAAAAPAAAASTSPEPAPSDLRDEDDFDDESIPF